MPSQVNVLGQMLRNKVVRSVTNVDGSISLILDDDSILQSVAPVYALPGKTITGVDTLPDANTFDTGAVVRLHKDNFVGAGVNPCGIEVRADALNNVWRPRGQQVIWSSDALGTRASPTVSRATAGLFNIGANPVLPGGLISYSGAKLRFTQLYFAANASTPGANMTVHLGTDLTTYTNNKELQDIAMLAANNLSVQSDTLFIRVSATSGMCTRTLLRGGIGTTGSVIQDQSGGLLNFASDQMLSYSISSMGAATQIDLLAYAVVWEY